MHRAIIFDLGKVLINFDFSRGYQALEALCPYAAAEIPRRLGSTDLVQRFETGLVEPRDFVSQLCRILDVDLPYNQFCSIWCGIFGETLIPEEMLEGLAARYRLLLLSNTNAIHYSMVSEQYPMLRHFHDRVLSFEVKAMKPRAEIFQEAIRRAGCPAGECFYTDDIPEYVEGARQEGIDAVRFESAAQIQRELLARGLSWQ